MPNWRVLAEEAVNVKIGNPPAGSDMSPEEGTGILIVARVNPNEQIPLAERKLIQIGTVQAGDNNRVKVTLDDAIEGKQIIPNQTELASGKGIDIPVTVTITNQNGEKEDKDITINIKSFADFDPKSILQQLRKIDEVDKLMQMNEALMELKRRVQSRGALGTEIAKMLQPEQLAKMLSSGN